MYTHLTLILLKSSKFVRNFSFWEGSEKYPAVFDEKIPSGGKV
jgi:hypothetical protein